MTRLLVVCLCGLLLSCSDDTTTPDASVDARVDVTADGPPGPDSCCGPDLAATDAPPAPDLPTADAPPVGPDSATVLDLPSAPDLALSTKLIRYALCSQDQKCKPYCGAIGSKSEGWFDGCTNQLMKDPWTGVTFWDQCQKCVVFCDAIGSWSEGWYAQCP